jgi:DNA repair protein RecO (recombination protein O)
VAREQRQRIYRSQAIVIGRLDLGETDRILTLFSRDRGKFRAVAKGIRRPTSKLGPSLEYFTHCELILNRGRNLDIITSVDVINRFLPLQTDVTRLGNASHLVELTNRLTEEEQELPAVFDLLVSSLHQLTETEASHVVARYFELAVLSLLGFRIELYQCTGCGEVIREETNYLSARSGGMLCPACRLDDSSARPMSVSAQKFVRTLDRYGLESALKLTLPQRTASEVEAALTGHVRAIAERDLSSLRVLREMNEGPGYLVGEAT